jgi:hypothetical protein
MIKTRAKWGHGDFRASMAAIPIKNPDRFRYRVQVAIESLIGPGL